MRGQQRIYSPFESFQHEVERARNRTALYYRMRVRDSMRNDGWIIASHLCAAMKPSAWT